VIALRIVVAVFALFLLLIVSRRYAKRRSGRLEFLVWLVISVATIVVAAYPTAAAPPLDFLAFRREDNRQLLGLLVVANFVLLFLYMRLSGIATAANRDISRLVRALAQREYRKEAVSTPAKADIVAVIPAYNEEATVGEVLKHLPRQAQGLNVQPLVVVDGCKDTTEEVVRRYAIPAVHAINRGQGAALLTGYELAVERGARVIVITDADAQTDLEELPHLVEPILNNEADFVNGSRWLGTYHRDSLVRAWGVRGFSLIVSVLTGTRVTDVASPFRAFRASEVPRLNLYEDQFQASELLIEALRKGLRFKEVPITMRKRAVGKSKKPNLPRYGLGVAKSIIQAWLR
jgi:hypothetical protein